MSQDIGPILKEWDEDPEAGNIRKIIGQDGKEKIQIKFEFGILQMEADGRPDAKRPYGKESLLEHYLSLLENYIQEYGNDAGFKLDSHDCERLRDESTQYYQRYVSFFELKDYERAERDTARNLRMFDLMKKCAEQQDDALSLEKYRPYVIMMNSRARAFIKMDHNDYMEAIGIIEKAIELIIDFYRDHELNESYISASQELAVLSETIKEIRNRWEG
jgi:tetratricopeptide (TPR) repeat protein